jgi:hypothetical protein
MATPLKRARRPPAPGQPGAVSYRQQYVRCGKSGCRRCPPSGPGHGPYWYGFYWDYRQRTRSFYVGKHLPPGATVLADAPAAPPGAAHGRPPPARVRPTPSTPPRERPRPERPPAGPTSAPRGLDNL